jgi:hypothetical protein
MTKGTGRGQHVDLPDIMTKSQEKKSYFDVLHVIVGRNFTMVGKKTWVIDWPRSDSGKIGGT